jgi:hypothetical protein
MNRSIYCLFSSVVEHFTCNEKVLGSIPKGGLYNKMK